MPCCLECSRAQLYRTISRRSRKGSDLPFQTSCGLPAQRTRPVLSPSPIGRSTTCRTAGTISGSTAPATAPTFGVNRYPLGSTLLSTHASDKHSPATAPRHATPPKHKRCDSFCPAKLAVQTASSVRVGADEQLCVVVRVTGFHVEVLQLLRAGSKARTPRKTVFVEFGRPQLLPSSARVFRLNFQTQLHAPLLGNDFIVTRRSKQ
jgi:hypothetical protein